MSDDETTLDELLYEMLWSLHRARRIRRRMRASQFAGKAAVFAVIDDHDRRNPDAPATGPDRVLSIVEHTMRLQDEIRDHPERFSPAVSLNVEPDPTLLLRADAVLRWLPRLITAPTLPTSD